MDKCQEIQLLVCLLAVVVVPGTLSVPAGNASNTSTEDPMGSPKPVSTQTPVWTSPQYEGITAPPAPCSPPNCLMPSTAPPGGLQPHQIPQMVLFTFNDPVTNHAYDTISKLFPPKRTNKNKKRIAATIFVTHNTTKYSKVRKLYGEGHEIACRSKTSRIPNNWWSSASQGEWETEIEGYRKSIAKESGIPVADIKGMRAPYFQPGGDNQFQMLHDHGFLYDSTLKAGPLDLVDPQYWPFTLDEGFDLPCIIPTCPPKDGSYPGVWEIPVQALINKNTELPCTFLQECGVKDKDSTIELLRVNFERNYKSRTPFVLNLQASWLKVNAFLLEAVDDFIDEILEKKDVWIVTSSQLISWMKEPTPVEKLEDFDPWKPQQEKNLTESTSTKLNETEKSKVKAKPSGGFITWPWGNVDDLWFYEYIVLAILLVIIILRDKARDD